jgi:hypothetical protein
MLVGDCGLRGEVGEAEGREPVLGVAGGVRYGSIRIGVIARAMAAAVTQASVSAGLREPRAAVFSSGGSLE